MVRRVVAALVIVAILALVLLLATGPDEPELAAAPEPVGPAPTLEHDTLPVERSDAGALADAEEAAPARRRRRVVSSQEELPRAGPERAALAVRVRVLIDEAPAPGVEVELLDIVSSASESAVDPILVGVTDFAGVVELLSPPTPELSVLASAPRGGKVLKKVDGLSGARETEVEVRFGSARVEGLVWDLEGRPAARALVQLNCTTAHWVARATADDNGAFAFESIAPGFVILSTLTTPMSGSPGHFSRFEATAHETTRVELGSPLRTATWKGRLRAPSGARLSLSLDLWAMEQTQHWKTQFESDPLGIFWFDLAAGEYDVFTYGRPDPLRLATVSIGAGETREQDLVAPAPIVYGEARWSDNGARVDARQIVLESGSGAESLTLPIHRGRFCAFAVPTGVWNASVYAARIEGAPDHGITLQVAPDSEIQLDLRLLR